MSIMSETVLIATVLIAPISEQSVTVSDSYINRNPVYINHTTFKPYVDIYGPINHSKISQFDKTEGEILSYINLTEGWDGYEAIVPDEETINSALLFLNLIKVELFPAPKAMLSNDGEVSLYWEAEGRYLEIGFDGENQFSYLIDSKDITKGEDDLVVDESIPTPLREELTIISKELSA